MKRIIIVLVISVLMLICFTACENEPSKTNTNTETTNKPESTHTIIKFSDLYETKNNIKNVSTMLKSLNGKKVEITGYPAAYSPLDSSFIYLNNQPYVTCPFCTIGNIKMLEVVSIYRADGGKIQYTENAVKVKGTLEVSEKIDTEGYTTQFRIYADRIDIIQDNKANKAINEYYNTLSEAYMIYDLQTLQMNIEYVSKMEYLINYDEKLSTGQSDVMDNVAVVKAIADEYIGFDSEFGHGYGSEYTYLDYIKECPEIVKQCEPTNERLKALNDELIKMYDEEIVLLEKYQNICYRIINQGDNITEKDADGYINELLELNEPNLKQFNEFTSWNNKLRE